MEVQHWVEMIEAAGGESEHLDDLVHDVFSQQASAVNNEGLTGQIECLVSYLGAEQTVKELTQILEELRKQQGDNADGDRTSGDD